MAEQYTLKLLRLGTKLKATNMQIVLVRKNAKQKSRHGTYGKLEIAHLPKTGWYFILRLDRKRLLHLLTTRNIFIRNDVYSLILGESSKI